MSGIEVGWNIANAAEYSIAFLALKAFWPICLIFVRRRKDKLRTPFLWLKWAIPLYLLFAALEITVQGITIFLSGDTTSGETLSEVATHISIAAAFIDDWADIFMQLCLVEVNLSSLRALGSPNYQKGIRYFNFALISVLAILAFAALGTEESWYVKFFNKGEYTSWATPAHLYGAMNIIWFIPSVPIIALSISVMAVAYRKQRMRWIARRLLAISILNFVRSTYELYFTANYYVGSTWLKNIPNVLGVIDPVLYFWVTIAMIGILVAIGMKKRNGLWTEQRQQQEADQWPQQPPGIPQYKPNGNVAVAAVYGGGQGHETAPVTLGQYQQQQEHLIRDYNSVWRPELAAIRLDQQQPLGMSNPVSPQSPAGSPPPYGRQEMDALPARGSILRRPTPQELQNTQVYEVGSR